MKPWGKLSPQEKRVIDLFDIGKIKTMDEIMEGLPPKDHRPSISAVITRLVKWGYLERMSFGVYRRISTEG